MEGLITVSAVETQDGVISTQKAVDYGFIRPQMQQPSGWGLEKHEVPLGYNLSVSNMRQHFAYLIGNRNPMQDYVIAKFGIGTGTTPPNVNDTDLISPVNFYSGGPLKPITSSDFPGAFIVRFTYSLGLSEANGYLLTEQGLYASNGTLLARKTMQGLNKTSDWAPTLFWRIRV